MSSVLVVPASTPNPSAELVKLTPIARTAPKRQFGVLKGKLAIPDEFFDPLPEEELEAWGQ